MAALANVLARLDPPPDLLLFAEVWLPWYAADLTLALQPHFRGIPYVGAWRPPGGLVALHYSASPWKVETTAFQPFWASGPWWRIWEGDGVGRKGVRYLALVAPNARVALLHTHWQAQYGRRSYTHVRELQAAALTQLAHSLARTHIAVFAAGDLNTLPSEPLFARLSFSWHDLTLPLRQSEPAATTTIAPGEWIDYVLALRGSEQSPELTAGIRVSPRDGPLDISDHHGIYVRVAFGKPGKNSNSLAAQS